MLELLLEHIVPEIISLLEIIGVVVITIGAAKAFFYYVKALFVESDTPIRIELANALALGLEFKMGAEILKTVLVRNFEEIYLIKSTVIFDDSF